MAKCAAPDCTNEGKSQCGRCKQRFYCGAECQRNDWAAHKAECKRLTAIANAPMSPFGQMFNVLDGSSRPMSNEAHFFDEMFGYTAADPKRVYKDLVTAYHLLRLGAHSMAPRVSAAMQGMDFNEWMERVARAGVLPHWWNTEVNGAGIETFTREDAYGRLDREVTVEEVRGQGPRLLALEMMVERIVNKS
ncbi:hypothetical protein B0H16DRAFT_1586389 [Mycena metata]|uniref:MYND-type domain-containing protein n=1 Tax=Mycena metata TaxID=1033252 RepID=A0AAD7MRS1_9AGAR|nr:hypothetical protein B0H16DRAFT_1586389 [Mycena metata]